MYTVLEKKCDQAQRKEGKGSTNGTKVRLYAWRKRESIKKRIIKLYDELENLPEAQLNKIFLDEYVEKIFKMGEIGLSSAKWKPGTADIKILELKKIPNLKTKKLEKKWIYPNDMKLTKEGELITDFEKINKTKPDRECILREHLKNLMEYYLPSTEIQEHDQLKYSYGQPSNVMRKLRKMDSDLHSVEIKNKNLIEFIKKEGLIEKYDSEENQKYDDEIRKNEKI